MFSNSCQLDLHHHNQPCVAIIYDNALAKSGLEIEPALIKLWSLEVHVWWILSLNTTQVLPIVSTIECVQNSQSNLKVSSNLFSLYIICLDWYLFFDPHRTTQWSNIGVWSRKVTKQYVHFEQHVVCCGSKNGYPNRHLVFKRDWTPNTMTIMNPIVDIIGGT